MDISLSVRVAPGETGVLESHTWKLKEAKTVSQVLGFVRHKIKPFLGDQSTLEVVVEDDEPTEKIEKSVGEVSKEDIKKQKLNRGPPGKEYGNPEKAEKPKRKRTGKGKREKSKKDEMTPERIKEQNEEGDGAEER
jgi:hypothetical protein